MAATLASLKAIYTTGRTDAALQTFVDMGNMIVDEDVKPNSSLSTDRYDKIATYLAAHFLHLSDHAGEDRGGVLVKQEMGDASESYAAPGYNMEVTGFETTRFGQAAISLDTSGTLAGQQANKGLKARFRVV